MADKATIYVPNDVPDAPNDPTDVIDNIIEDLSDQYGGATQVESFGCWKAPDGRVVKEPVTKVESVNEEIDDDHVRELGQLVKDMLQEESVMVEISETDVSFV